jgi:hypothetical protein
MRKAVVKGSHAVVAEYNQVVPARPPPCGCHRASRCANTCDRRLELLSRGSTPSSVTADIYRARLHISSKSRRLSGTTATRSTAGQYGLPIRSRCPLREGRSRIWAIAISIYPAKRTSWRAPPLAGSGSPGDIRQATCNIKDRNAVPPVIERPWIRLSE